MSAIRNPLAKLVNIVEPSKSWPYPTDVYLIADAVFTESANIIECVGRGHDELSAMCLDLGETYVQPRI